MRPVERWRRRRRWRITAALLIVAAVSALDHGGALGRRATPARGYDGRIATVVYAADGDTVDLDVPDGGRPSTRVRLWGVDCPEIAHGPGEVDAYFGREATEFVRRQVVGRRVRIELDPNRSSRDRYGRLLAYLYVLGETEIGKGEVDRPVAGGEGVLLNRLLIERGLGYADRRFDHVRKKEFVEAEKRARRDVVGLWAGVQREQMPAWRRSASD
jgi:endonuclease YncB( thermonuclease family)